MSYLELLFIVALVLYTVVIWTHKFQKNLKTWMIIVFGVALVTDTTATIVVCVLASVSWEWNLHTITGFASLLIMALHFGWAVGAKAMRGNTEEYFNTYSPYAWLLWFVAFISGIPLAG